MSSMVVEKSNFVYGAQIWFIARRVIVSCYDPGKMFSITFLFLEKLCKTNFLVLLYAAMRSS